MKLIIGGAFQGKLEYARTQYGLADGWIDGADCVPEAIEGCRGIFHSEAFRPSPFAGACRGGTGVGADGRALCRDGGESRLYEKNPELIVVTRELGCGIVPIRHRRTENTVRHTGESARSWRKEPIRWSRGSSAVSGSKLAKTN